VCSTRRVAALLALLLLLLCSAAPCLTAAQSPAASGRPGCPGVVGGVCGEACQATICAALASFYAATNGPLWRFRSTGWPTDNGTDACKQWLAQPPPTTQRRAAAGGPRFCAVAGVFCCSSVAPGPPGSPCPFQHAPTNLTLLNFNLTGRVDNPRLWEALNTLITCGVRRVIMQGNRLSGTVPTALPQAAAGWLKTLDVSENALTGTLVGWGGRFGWDACGVPLKFALLQMKRGRVAPSQHAPAPATTHRSVRAARGLVGAAD